MNTFDKRLGNRVKALRKRAGMSQEKLASLMRLNRSTISQIEAGNRAITAHDLSDFSRVFGVSVQALLDPKAEPQVVLPREGPKTEPAPQIRISVPQKNLRKFREILLYILNRVGSKRNVGETVLYKLLYFIDFDYYEKYEKQIIGATYQKNHFGPTPIEFKKVVEEMAGKGELIQVKSKHFEYDQKKYLPMRDPDLSVLSGKELEMIDDVLNRLSDMSARQISAYSHDDLPWKVTEDQAIIDYETVFYRAQPYSRRDYPEDD